MALRIEYIFAYPSFGLKRSVGEGTLVCLWGQKGT